MSNVKRRCTKCAPANAFSTLILDGAIHNEQHESQKLIFMRQEPHPNPPFISPNSHRVVHPHTPPTLPPSRLPPPGDMTLSLRLGRQLGYGSIGRVYEANVVLSSSSPELQNLDLPPLAVKISRRDKASALLPEGQNYEDMEFLQGVTIPRYFGLYSTTVSDDKDFLPWLEKDAVKNDDASTPEDYTTSNVMTDVLPANSVSIVVMERVGGRLPIRHYPESVHKEIQAMYNDMASFGMYHADIRYGNILLAPKTKPHSCLSSKGHSPYWPKPYHFRLVDFHKSARTNILPLHNVLRQSADASRLLDGFAFGDIIEPWHGCL